MTNITEKLRNMASNQRAALANGEDHSSMIVADLLTEAAAEIKRLRDALATARADALEEAARVADRLSRSADGKFAGVMQRHRNGERNLELAAATAAGMDHQARGIAAAIRALKEAK